MLIWCLLHLNVQALIGLTVAKRDSNRARNERRQAKRMKRDKAIMRLHLLEKSVSDIVKLVPYACNTVASVVHRYGSNLSALFSRKELTHLRKLAVKPLIAGMHTEERATEQGDFKFGRAKL